MSKLDIKLVKIATGALRANGQIERVHRSTNPMLAKLTDQPDHWDKYVNKVEFVMNDTKSQSTGKTPSQLLFGIDQRGEVPDPLKDLVDINSLEVRDLMEMRKNVSESIQKHQAYNKNYFE